MSARQTLDTPNHRRQASQLRDQLQGLLPDSFKPANIPDNIQDTAETAANEAGDGIAKLLQYVPLALEYWEPISALLQRARRRVPEVAAEAVAPARRRFGVHPLVAVGVAVGIGLAAYGAARAVQDFQRNA